MLNLVGGRALAAAGGCLAIAGCTALAGIQDGTLVTAGDSGSGGDVTTTDGNGADGPQGDGPVADGGGDSTVDGNGMDSPTPSETATETGPSGFNSVCFLVNNSTILLDDLSTAPMSFGSQFSHALWVVTANIGDGVYVVSQGQNENTDFALYQVDFTQQNVMKTLVPNLGTTSGSGGVRLLDVEPTPSGTPMALASYSNAANQAGLQLVPLPTTWGGAIGAATSIVAPPLLGTNVFPQSGTLAATATQSYWLLTTSSGSNRALVAGAANTAMTDTLLTTSTMFNASSVPYFDLSGQAYAFVQGLGDGGNSDTVLAVPDTFGTAGVQAPVTSTASLFAIIGARVSATDATKAALLGVSLDTSGNGQMWAARLPPSSLTSLSLSAPQFTAGDLLSINDLSFNGGSNFWYGDQFFAVGQGQGPSGPDQIILDWFDSNGHAVARPTTSGPIYTGTNTVDLAAGGVNMVIGGIAGLFIAWIEDVFPEAGVHYQKLFAAKVSCSLAAGGG